MPSTTDLNETELASLLCSRLCHDLLSPIGAMNNGLELLADETDPEMRARCIELLTDSARASANKLKFFRLAFGAAGGFGDKVDVSEPRQLIEGLVADKPRVELQWHVPSAMLAKPAVKVLLNLALIGLDGLVRGGQLIIAAEEQDGQCEIAVNATGPKVVIDETLAHALQGDMASAMLSPRTAPAFMIERIARANGGTIQLAATPESLIIGAMLRV
ncbi:histidine phosphotransferase family protein [Blastomonas sp. SL216]|jgi:histidine phosphotransferase ChpT|uniref:histidine phosphotransferase family protein n=1 Tax=Blastomonas sp. SL216 TaxID=2995169 RepID=UPI0023779989|nr:histidine phosphotransferase family protein [Blastomonas sp. SL216]